MSLPVILQILTLVISALTLLIVSVELLPKLKQGMEVVRDAVLWTALVVVVIMLSVAGWQHLRKEPKNLHKPGVVRSTDSRVDFFSQRR